MEPKNIFKDFSKHTSLSVGILSDTHGYINPYIERQLSNCEVILHAGDIGSIHVIRQLKQNCKNVISVRGNNDIPEKWAQDEHKALHQIPTVAEIKLPGGSIVLTHGDKFNPVAKRHDKMRTHFANASAIVYGHSHKLVCDQKHQPWVLNPGAAGKRITKGGASCLVMHTKKDHWQISEFRDTT